MAIQSEMNGSRKGSTLSQRTVERMMYLVLLMPPLVMAQENEQSTTIANVTEAANSREGFVSSDIFYSESMLIVSGNKGVVAVIFDRPSMAGDSQNGRFLLEYRWRFDNGTDTEQTGQGLAYTGFQDGQSKLRSNTLKTGPYEVAWETIDLEKGKIFFNPVNQVIQQVDKKYFETQELLGQKFTAIDLSEWRLNSTLGDRNPGGNQAVTRIHYVRQDVVVVDQQGVSVIHFDEPFDVKDGRDQRYGVSFRSRFVPFSGGPSLSQSGEVYEQYIDGTYNDALTKHDIESGNVKLHWSRSGLESGWIYFHPSKQVIWLVSPELGEKLLDEEESLEPFRSFQEANVSE